MLLNRGTLDGVRVLGRKTVEYMTINHLPTGADLVTMGRRSSAKPRTKESDSGLASRSCLTRRAPA